ncbi:hypothetical protein AAFF_G00223710 [Aldrovandia affinis]|uniref:peptidylprolyl isomerase n=1 Tax=Aldrovandia affinis TaxID=143900 RepID=A0AAD7TBY9_9TELE|nr:hypothetical protein AAFF_G00223710 [Aldrovandia affinis]
MCVTLGQLGSEACLVLLFAVSHSLTSQQSQELLRLARPWSGFFLVHTLGYFSPHPRCRESPSRSPASHAELLSVPPGGAMETEARPDPSPETDLPEEGEGVMGQCGTESDGDRERYESDDAPHEAQPEDSRTLRKTPSFGKTVRFRLPSEVEQETEEQDPVEESLFPEYESEEWASSSFEELFLADDWVDITDDRLLKKKVLEPGVEGAALAVWGQEVTVQLQGVLEDRTVVEKDSRLTFVIGEGDVNQALEECVLSMQLEEIALLLADSQYTYGLLGRYELD